MLTVMIHLIASSLTYWLKVEAANNKSRKNTQTQNKKIQRNIRENKNWKDQEIEVDLTSKPAAYFSSLQLRKFHILLQRKISGL
jgi:hypothetical protein